MLDQVDAFHRGRAEAGEKGEGLTLSLSRVGFLAKNEADKHAKIAAADDYYSRFDNLYTGAGLVDAGMIRPLPRTQSAEELGESVLVCTTSEMIDKLGPYAEAGVDRMVFNINFGASQADTLESIQQIAEEVMPHFANTTPAVAAE